MRNIATYPKEESGQTTAAAIAVEYFVVSFGDALKSKPYTISYQLHQNKLLKDDAFVGQQ